MLKRRLSMVETDDSYAARVRSALMELLPSGGCTVDDVAKKLGYSKRCLISDEVRQRFLQPQNDITKTLHIDFHKTSQCYIFDTK